MQGSDLCIAPCFDYMLLWLMLEAADSDHEMCADQGVCSQVYLFAIM